MFDPIAPPEVSTGECATDDCKAGEAAEAAAQEQRTEELQKQHQDVDNKRVRQAQESNSSSSKASVSVPPGVVQRARTANTGGIQNPNVNRPKYDVKRQESESRLIDPSNRDPSTTRRNPPGVSIEIR